MAFAILEPLITPEYFEWEAPPPLGDARGELEQQIDHAIESGDAEALDAASAAIALLDAIDGDPDAEPLDEREDDYDELLTWQYGIDQTAPARWAARVRQASLTAARCEAWNSSRRSRRSKPCRRQNVR